MYRAVVGLIVFLLIWGTVYAIAENVTVSDSPVVVNASYLLRDLIWGHDVIGVDIEKSIRNIIWGRDVIGLDVEKSIRNIIDGHDVIVLNNTVVLASKCPVLDIEPDLMYPGYRVNVSMLVWAVNETRVEVYVDGELVANRTIYETSRVAFNFTPGWTGPNVTEYISIEGDGNYTCSLAPYLVTSTEFSSVEWSYDGFGSVTFRAIIVYAGTSILARGEELYITVNGSVAKTLTVSDGHVSATVNLKPGTWLVCAELMHGNTTCRVFRVSGLGGGGVPSITIPPIGGVGGGGFNVSLPPAPPPAPGIGVPGLDTPGGLIVTAVALALFVMLSSRMGVGPGGMVFSMFLAGYGAVASNAYMFAAGVIGLVLAALYTYIRSQGV